MSLRRHPFSLSVFFAGLLCAGMAQAGDARCRSTLTGSYDNVVVPADASCTLRRAQVSGSVQVMRGARLFSLGSQIEGNVQADDAAGVDVTGGRVGGNVQIKRSRAITVSEAIVVGDVQLEQNTGVMVVNGNRIQGGLQVMGNRSARLGIDNNRVQGDLQCKQNSPRPTGTRNEAAGKHGECRGL